MVIGPTAAVPPIAATEKPQMKVVLPATPASVPTTEPVVPVELPVIAVEPAGYPEAATASGLVELHGAQVNGEPDNGQLSAAPACAYDSRGSNAITRTARLNN